MPQSVHAYGGFRVQGKDRVAASKVLDDARAISSSGAFTIVIEGVMEPVAREITEVVTVPTIGIGASSACDGQVLVTEDVVGLFSDFTPKFVRRYANLGEAMENGRQSICRRCPGTPVSGSRALLRCCQDRGCGNSTITILTRSRTKAETNRCW